MLRMLFPALLLAAGLTAVPAGATQGVADDEVVIGSVNDLSGPFAAFGAPAVAAARMHFEAVNAAGGIHGRQIRFIVEDMGYQLPKAVQAYNKLVNGDRVFAMLLSLGTPMNLAGFELLTGKGIPNLSPLSASREMLREPVQLKFAATSFYYDQMLQAARYLADQKGVRRLCAMFMPTDFGLEMQAALADAAAADDALDLVVESTHKPDEMDFTGALQRLDAEGCDLVGLALGLRQTITVVGTAKRLGLHHMSFIGTAASFHSVVAAVPGGVTEGLYTAAGWSDLAARAGEPEVDAFIAAWQAVHGEPPGTGAVLGYASAQTLTRALEQAGAELTVDSLVAAMESLSFHDPILNNQVEYSPADHQGADAVVLSVVEGGQWKELARFE